jgi:hypothetical protein
LSILGYDPDQCLDFDLAVIDFMEWYDSKAEERVVGPIKGRQPKDKETWVPKYKTVDSILALYHAERGFADNISPEIAAVTDSAIRDLLDDAFGDEYL